MPTPHAHDHCMVHPSFKKTWLGYTLEQKTLGQLPLTLLIGAPQHRSCTNRWEQICKQVKGIPNGKHQRDLQGPPQLCVCPPNAWNPVAISCTRPGKPVTQTKSVSALHFSVASASPSGFCKVFPVDLADSLCWHVAKSAQNITICWPQPGLSFVFVWP